LPEERTAVCSLVSIELHSTRNLTFAPTAIASIADDHSVVRRVASCSSWLLVPSAMRVSSGPTGKIAQETENGYPRANFSAARMIVDSIEIAVRLKAKRI
jgi:hypothetical protein